MVSINVFNFHYGGICPLSLSTRLILFKFWVFEKNSMEKFVNLVLYYWIWAHPKNTAQPSLKGVGIGFWWNFSFSLWLAICNLLCADEKFTIFRRTWYFIYYLYVLLYIWFILFDDSSSSVTEVFRLLKYLYNRWFKIIFLATY